MKFTTDWRDAMTPSLTETYSPVAHSELIFLLEKQLNESGYKVDNVSVNQSYNGEQIGGMMTVTKEGYGGDFQQSLAFTNSYNKRLPIQLASGARVFVCSNGMIVSEVLTLRKHTGEVFPALKNNISIAIDGMGASFDRTQRDVQIMKEIDLTERLAAELLGRLHIEERIINSYEMNEAVRQWRKPTFSDFDNNSMWSFYNAVTYAAKDSKPERQIKLLKELHEFSVDFAQDFETIHG
jgi:hypothetical protein